MSIAKALGRGRPALFAAALFAAALAALLLPDLAFADEEIASSDPNWLLDPGKAITKTLYDILRSPVEGMMGLAGEFYGILAKGQFVGGDLSAFPQVQTVVKDIINRVLVPISQGVLGFMLAFELLQIEHDIGTGSTARNLGLGGFERFIFFAVKYAALYVVINHIYAIMAGVFAIFNWVSDHLLALVGSGNIANAIDAGMLDAALNTLTYDQFGQIFIYMLVALVTLVVCALTCFYGQVLAISRIFEIFVLIAMSPLPITTFANRKLSDVGTGFVKTFCSACLQLAVIYAIVGIGGPLIASVSSTVGGLFTSTDTGVQMLLKCSVPIVSCLSLYTMLKASRGISNHMTGASPI